MHAGPTPARLPACPPACLPACPPCAALHLPSHLSCPSAPSTVNDIAAFIPSVTANRFSTVPWYPCALPRFRDHRAL
jgi:hypothetical protein